MKKIKSQLSIAVVCAILGFMTAYQFKLIYKQNTNIDPQKQNAEILLENEQLRKEKEEYLNKLAELEKKIAEYENSAASRDEQSKWLLNALKESRLLTGSTDVEGAGIIMYITPKSNIFGNNFEVQPINDMDLVTIVNELNSADAEAVSINDIRLTSTSGIRNAGNSILINDERISYNDKVTIKAIGNVELLEHALSFPGNIPAMLREFCDIEWETYEKINIPKVKYTVEFKYAKPVDK